MKKIFSIFFLSILFSSLSAQDIQTLFDDGIKEMESRNFSKAIELFTKALSIKEDGAIYYNRGVCYGQIGEYQNAINDFTKTIESNPDLSDAYNGRGLGYYSLKEYEKAIADFSKAIELNTINSDAYFNRGKAYKDIGEYYKAIYDFAKTVVIVPRHPFAYYERGYAYYAIKDCFNAKRDWNIAIELNPDFEKELKPLIEKCK